MSDKAEITKESPRRIPVAFAELALSSSKNVTSSGKSYHALIQASGFVEGSNVVFHFYQTVKDIQALASIRKVELHFSRSGHSRHGFAKAAENLAWKFGVEDHYYWTSHSLDPVQEFRVDFETRKYMDPVAFKGELSLSESLLAVKISIPFDDFQYIAKCTQRMAEAQTNVLFYEKDLAEKNKD